jgi:hypothetical protein
MKGKQVESRNAQKEFNNSILSQNTKRNFWGLSLGQIYVKKKAREYGWEDE